MTPNDDLAPGRGESGALAQAVQALLQDRRSERHWRIFFRLAWLVLVVAAVVVVLARSGPAATTSTPHTALVDIQGVIAPDTEASAERIVSALQDAFRDHGAKAIVLRFNSPGGSPVQAGIVNDEIRRLKQLYDKKVYAVVEDACASGAYYIAVAADAIYVDKASLVGSIGVLMDGFGFTGLMDRLGIERRLLTSGEHKGMLDPYSPTDPAEVAHARNLLDEIHAQFIAAVKAGRGERLKAGPDVFSGLFWNGDEAVKLGLADHLGNLDYVAREVVHAEEVVDYTVYDNVAERLVKRFGAAIGAGFVQALRGVAPLR